MKHIIISDYSVTSTVLKIIDKIMLLLIPLKELYRL